MKTLHQQQDLHHHADVRKNNKLAYNKGQQNFEHTKSNMKPSFTSSHHIKIENHTLDPFFKSEKNTAENIEIQKTKTSEVTKSIIEAYTKQIELSLDATKKIHKEFTEQITTLYNLNQQFWNTLFSRHIN